MKLSTRLKAVTDLLTRGLRVADIGCDHAYISIYLLENQIASHVIAMDVNVGPLKRAKHNIESYGFGNDIETRLSDGAKCLKPGEVDTLLIAGMGGALVRKILMESSEVVSYCEELVLQPQSEIFLVRRYLHEIGYTIVEENMLIDDGKYYTMMKARKGKETYENPIFYLYGKDLLVKKNVTLHQFLQRELEKKVEVIGRLQGENDRLQERIDQLNEEIEYLREGLSYYDL